MGDGPTRRPLTISHQPLAIDDGHPSERSPMPYEFKLVHRVEFADTDMAGIIHFASYFRYLEVTEHAFFRSLGLSIMGDGDVGWPRVHVACDFKHPLRFEEEVEAH